MKSLILTQTNFNKLKDEVKKNKEKNLIFNSEDDNLNRKVLEKLPIQTLLINLSKRKDFQKQRNSGFNHVLAKIAKKKNISIGIDLDEIIESSGKKKAEIISRIIQNIMVCNKNKIQMNFVSKKYSKNLYDLKSLGLILGMPTWMTSSLESVKI